MSNRATTSPATQPSQAGKSPMMTSGPAGQTAIPYEKIAKRAYEKWCKRGCKHGTDQQDWHEAEAELRAEMMGRGMPTAQPMQPSPTRPQAAPAMPQKSPQRS